MQFASINVKNKQLLILSLLILILVGARILRASYFELHHDEVWSIWQTFGTPAQIIQWTPYDWASLYYLTLGAWRLLVGINPIMLSFLSVFFSMLTMAFLYRVGRDVTGKFAGGAVAMLLFGAFHFSIYQSVILRGYSQLIFLSVFAFWLMLRYFKQPTLKQSIALGVLLAAMLYVHFSAVFAFIAFGIYTLVTTPKKIHLWVAPFITLFILNIPQLPKQSYYLLQQSNFSNRAPPQMLVENVQNLFIDVTGEAWIVTLIALIVSILAHLRFRIFSRQVFILAVWAMIPIWIYFVPRALTVFIDPITGMYLSRYFWWLAIPFTLSIANGIARAPKFIIIVISAGLLLSTASTISHSYEQGVLPYRTNFDQLAQEIQWGDVILIDESISINNTAYLWQYFTDVYLPFGIEYIDTPSDHQRIWYVSVDGRQNADVLEELQTQYVAGKFFGPWNFLFRLYEAPPNREGILFENGMRFHGAEILGSPDPVTTTFHEGETIRLRLWWSVDSPPPQDYSVGVYLFDAASTLHQEDNSAPQVLDAPSETSRWEIGRYYIEEREITLPSNINTQTFSLYLAVYQWWDGQRILAEGLNEDQLYLLNRFDIKTWWLP